MRDLFRIKLLGAKLRQFFQDIGRMIRDTIDSYKDTVPGSPEGRLIRKMEDLYSQLQEAFAEGVMDAGENFQNAENTTSEGGVRYSLKIKYTNGYIEEIADARSVSDDKVLEYLRSAKTGKLYRDTYIPVRKDTPQVIIDTLEQVNEKVDNLSMVMQVRKARLSMGLDANNKKKGYGSNVRKHGLSPEEILEILHNLGNPSMLVYQTNRKGKNGEPLPNNVVVFVNYMSGESEGLAVIEFESSINPDYIGKEFGDTSYHTVVTVFEPDVERQGLPFDYAADELLLDPNNTELKIIRRQNTRSATGEKHPNTSSELPSKETLTQPEAVVKKISTTDSDGNQLTAGQQQYFAESEAVDENGNLLALFHQTAEDITEFDPKHPGAGRSDYKTPFGIFLKRTDKDIGLQGKKQMRLYAKATNPLRAENREDLVRKLCDISPEYAAACDEITEMNRTYEKRVEDAGQKINDYMIEWRRNNPDASRRAIYDDATYNELSDAEDALVEEWVAKDNELSVKAKEILTAALIDAGYDSIFLTKDEGSFGRETDAIIVLNPNQVKSVDNKNPTDHPDIRYSIGSKTDGAVQALLEKENDALREDVARLTELLKLQGTETHGTRFTPSSVEAAARYLKKNASAKGNSKELAKLLNGFYEYIARTKELTWEGVREQAEPIAICWSVVYHTA